MIRKNVNNIIDPLTGKYIEGVKEVSVVTTTGVLGEVVSTSLIVNPRIKAKPGLDFCQPEKVKSMEKAYFEWADKSDVLYLSKVWNTCNSWWRKDFKEYKLNSYGGKSYH